MILGSDTQSTIDDSRPVTTGPKWAVSGGKALAVSGYHLQNQIIRRNAEWLLEPADPWGVLERLKEVFEPWIVPHGDRGPKNWDFSGILVLDGIWRVSCDFSYWDGGSFWAEGSGREYAFGAWYASSGGEDGVRTAIAAACEYDLDCGGVWTCLTPPS